MNNLSRIPYSMHLLLLLSTSHHSTDLGYSKGELCQRVPTRTTNDGRHEYEAQGRAVFNGLKQRLSKMKTYQPASASLTRKDTAYQRVVTGA